MFPAINHNIYKQEAFSLIELTISLALGAFILALFITTFISNRQTAATQTSLHLLQQNAIVVSLSLRQVIRLRGLVGCRKKDKTLTFYDSMNKWPVNLSIKPYKGKPCLTVYHASPDFITVKEKQKNNFTLNKKPNWRVGDWLVASNCERAGLWRVKSIHNNRVVLYDDKSLSTLTQPIWFARFMQHRFYLNPTKHILYEKINDERAQAVIENVSSMHLSKTNHTLRIELRLESLDEKNTVSVPIVEHIA